jgi:ankyrin repeat protein
VAVACRNALFLTDPYVDRESVISAKGTRVSGTCEWITHNKSYRAWLNGDGDGSKNYNRRLLWISGGPGKGKTMMSVFLTEELERHTASIPNAELAFFFCSAQDDRRNTAIAVLRGLVHQIIAKRPQLARHALPHFETPERTQETLSSLETLWIIFSKLIADAELRTIFCVLDGLDECEDSTLRGLLPRLVGLLAGGTPISTHGTFKLVIVSRDIPGLRSCTMRVRLDPDNDKKVGDDIQLFVSARVAELLRIDGFNNDFRASVQAALLARAEGTFLWVGFAMHELLQKETCSEILEVLRDLPSGLPAIYSRMLLQIPVKRRAVSRAILHWVTLALRPLELQELAAAIGLQALPLITVEQATRDAIALCGPLLKIRDQKVGFVHKSARDYLLKKNHGSDPALKALSFDPESGHLELTRKCLDCIAQSELRNRTIDLDAKPELGESPLLRYAARHWPKHARKCSILVTNLFSSFGLFLQQHSPVRMHWWKTYHATKRGYQPIAPPLLHMACFLDIVPWVEAVLADNGRTPLDRAHWDVKDERGQTAFHWAVQGGSVRVVQLLLDNGANIEARDNSGRTALFWVASSRGREAMMRLLVNRGADVEAKNNNNATTLHSAAFRGFKPEVQLLVDLGADIEAKDKDNMTALHLAAWRGSEAVVRLLVGLGADVKARDSGGKTALFWAVSEGSEVVVRLLVEFGADIKVRDNSSKTVLHSAASSQKQNEIVVQLLVDLGADIEAKDKDNMTALHLAAQRGSEAVVRPLVGLGADIETQDSNGKTALHWAAWRGSEAVVRLLVGLGADIEARDSDGKTALHWAVQEGNEAVVQLLVGLGADIEARDSDGKTALHWAVQKGNEAVVQLLVGLGADIEARDSDGKTALHWAVQEGNEAVVQLLVGLGADIEARDSDGKTALFWAALSWREEEAIVRLLVDLGANIEAKDKNGETVLYQAAFYKRGDSATTGGLWSRH